MICEPQQVAAPVVNNNLGYYQWHCVSGAQAATPDALVHLYGPWDDTPAVPLFNSTSLVIFTY